MAEALANTAPLPVLTPETTPFWTGGAENRLMIARCSACTRFHHPPLPICPHCRSFEVAAEAVTGRGIVDSFTINYQPWLPGMRVPFTIALVALDEDPAIRLTTNLVNQLPEAARIGQRVRVLFEQHDNVWLPLFEPDAPCPISLKSAPSSVALVSRRSRARRPALRYASPSTQRLPRSLMPG